ncbi:ATP-dependent zinc protease [Candidatus Saccharibacteria bacterium]|nr:MAG: ATP-dependent zinc protease [Candidatus Saccharibacteria bacterium]
MTKQRTIGCLERVDFPAFGIVGSWAKVDTGAYSGALHCTNIKVVRRTANGERVLKFSPLGQAPQETTEFMSTYVRSATGHRVRRHVIDTQICIGGKEYPVRIGLSDRSDMKRPVLLGRRFLRENSMLVDVCINQEFDDEGEGTK